MRRPTTTQCQNSVEDTSRNLQRSCVGRCGSCRGASLWLMMAGNATKDKLMLVYRIETAGGRGAYMACLDDVITGADPTKARCSSSYDPRALPSIFSCKHSAVPDKEFHSSGTKCAWKTVKAMVHWFVPDAKARRALASTRANLVVLDIPPEVSYWADGWQVGYYESDLTVIARIPWADLTHRAWRQTIKERIGQ